MSRYSMLNIINSPTNNRNRVALNRTESAPASVSVSAPASASAPTTPPTTPTSHNRTPIQINMNNIPLASYSPTPFTYDDPHMRRENDYLSNRRIERLRRSRSLNSPSDDYNYYISANGNTVNRLVRIQNGLNRNRKQTQLDINPLSPRLIIKTKIIECAICQNKIDKKNITITKCDHAFCASCLFKNIRYNNKCPLCREVIALPPVKIYNLSPEVIEHVIHQQITLHEDTLKNTISNFINEHINNLNQEDAVQPLLNEEEIMDITVKILESMSIFSTGVCRNISRRIDIFNNANQ